MSERYLDPAYTLINAFSDGRGIMHGVKQVAALTKRNPVSVYRWMAPREKKGTGGFIPADSMCKLAEHHRKPGCPKALADFFGGDRAVA